jgi:hypothetical protein
LRSRAPWRTPGRRQGGADEKSIQARILRALGLVSLA